MLASVDDLVDLALDVPQFILLLLEFVWLPELRDVPRQTLDLLAICRVLHLQIVVVLDEGPDLLFESLVIHRVQLVLQMAPVTESHRSKAILVAR